MAETAAAPAPAASPKKATKKAAKPKAAGKKTSSHPPYAAMIKRAVTELKDKKGSGRAAILKFILSHYKVEGNPKNVGF